MSGTQGQNTKYGGGRIMIWPSMLPLGLTNDNGNNDACQ